LFLMQHTPVTTGCLAFLPTPFPSGEPLCCASPVSRPAPLLRLCQARAPPAISSALCAIP
jgi:hypothetical protein